MQIVDAFAAVGEVLSWIGLGVGIPLLTLAGMVALAEGSWEPTEIAVIERDGVAMARWFASGDFYERQLSAREEFDAGWHPGFVSVRNPGHARLTRPVLRRLFATLGGVFSFAGLVGFVASMLPAFL